MTALTISPGRFQHEFESGIARLEKLRVLERLWAGDHTLWADRPDEIANRLGWLDAPARWRAHGAGVAALLEGLADPTRVRPARSAGAGNGQRGGGHIDRVLVVGMGGSSLAPRLFGRAYESTGLEVRVLDSTVPAVVQQMREWAQPDRTLVIVSSKSGTTAETAAFCARLLTDAVDALGTARAGRHFVAITDPGSALAKLARRAGFRAVFDGDPDVGGRYSALTAFGLVPAALAGADLAALLGTAEAARGADGPGIPPADSPGARLGAALGVMSEGGADKLVLVAPGNARFLAAWLEQLIAESTGKAGRGILPVIVDAAPSPTECGTDQVFVELTLGDRPRSPEIGALETAGQPVIHASASELAGLGGLLFHWEVATAVACHILGVNPFDQPDVEAAKVHSRAALAAQQESGGLPAASAAPRAAAAFLAEPADYIALLAFLPEPEVDAGLAALRQAIAQRTGSVVTVGYGPRYLHSTGQLHKGDAGRGRFLVLTADDALNVEIPDLAAPGSSGATFADLKRAQAVGDSEALRAAGRPALQVHLGADMSAGLEGLALECGGAAGRG